MDALRRNVRLVCTSATRVGVVGRARSAAVAAAADNAAADAAVGLAVAVVSGCGLGGRGLRPNMFLWPPKA